MPQHMTEEEILIEVQQINRSIDSICEHVNLHAQALRARLDNLTGNKPVVQKVSDWKKEVDSWNG